MPLKAEAVEQRLLHHPAVRPSSASRSPAPQEKESAHRTEIKVEFFNAIDRLRPLDRFAASSFFLSFFQFGGGALI